jgi:threonylcarbamoyladenosine tRNA methylthiotransferase MtaB
MRRLAETETLKYRQSMLGKDQTVLVEKVVDGMAQGYGENYIPLKFPAGEIAVNTFVKVRLTSIAREEDYVLSTVIQ